MLTGLLGFRRLRFGSIGGRFLRKLNMNVPKTRYAACWTEDDGVYFCGHEHATIADSMNCLVPDGGSFIRAFENGICRSLSDDEYHEFLAALRAMPWSRRKEISNISA
jgi:hypothetical protein